MLSISNRAALCLAGLALSGCMQSMPTAESLTKPTVEAFTRLSSWTPWASTPQQAPPLVLADVSPAPTQPSPAPTPLSPAAAPEAALAVAPAAEPPVKPVELRHPVEKPKPRPAPSLATARTVPVVAAPVRASAAPEGGQLLPAAISCQTTSRPGERVRMECKPAD